MSELTNIHARSAKDLTVPNNLPADSNLFNRVKIVAGNMPYGYEYCEAITLGQVREVIEQTLVEDLTEENQEQLIVLKQQITSEVSTQVSDAKRYAADAKLSKEQVNTISNQAREQHEETKTLVSTIITANNGIGYVLTETELLKLKPSEATKLMKALDTKSLWLWSRSSEEGVTPVVGNWINTGLSELDQAKDYANQTEKRAVETSNKKISQFFNVDFHSENGPSLVLVDQNNNIVLAIKDNKLVPASAVEYLRDFHTENFKATYISVDKNFNILNSGDGASSGLDTTRLQDFAFYPEVLKTGDVYSDFGFLRDQKNWDDDLYKLPVSNFVPNHQSVYNFYDQLVSQNSTRFSMEVIGHDALDNEIRQYTYTPRALASVNEGNSDSKWDAEAIAPPKLVILTGVHGGTEKEAILQLMIFMNEIFNRYTEIEEAALLRQAQLVIIPCSTPSAIDLGTRTNHAGVDVNRNARDGFQGAGGTALSQPECALAVDLPNRHPDAACFIDHHNYSNSGMTAWFATHGLGNSLDVIRKVAYELNTMTPARFPFLASRPVRLGKNANGTIARDWQLVSDKKGYLIETAIDEGVYPSFELRQHGLTVLRKSLSAIYLSEFEV